MKEHILSVLSVLGEYDCEEFYIKIRQDGGIITLDRKTGTHKVFSKDFNLDTLIHYLLMNDPL